MPAADLLLCPYLPSATAGDYQQLLRLEVIVKGGREGERPELFLCAGPLPLLATPLLDRAARLGSRSASASATPVLAAGVKLRSGPSVTRRNTPKGPDR